AGVGAVDAARVTNLVAGSIDPAGLPAGTQVDITLGRRAGPGQARPLDALSFRARFDLKLAVSRSNGGFALRSEAIPVNTMPLRIRGTIGAGLYRSARAAGAP
ncbi:MAG: M23 family peptidase, partial [Novosphingobium sp.]